MLSENRVLLSKALDFLSPLWRMVKPLVPRSSTSSLLIIAFTVSYLSVFITPILSGIVQDISFSDPLCIVLFLCDFGYFCDFLRYWRETSQSDDNSGDQLSNDKQQRYFQFFVHTLSFSNLFLVPIGVVAGVKGSDLAWISILRMAKIVHMNMYLSQIRNRFESQGRQMNEAQYRLLVIFTYCTLYVALLFLSMIIAIATVIIPILTQASTSSLLDHMLAIHASLLLLSLHYIPILIRYLSFMASLWFYIACPASYTEDNRIEYRSCPVSNTWVSNDAVIDVGSVASTYVRAMHFQMQTLFTVGFGDISPISTNEMFLTLFAVLVASLFYALLISSMTSYLNNREVTTKKFRGEFEVLKRFLTMRSVPPALNERIRGFQEYLFTQQFGMNTARFLHRLPSSLQCDIRRQNGGYLLRTVPFFKRQDHRFVSKCVENLEYKIYSPGTFVYKQDEKNREIIMLRSGRIDLFVGGNKSSIFTLVSGDYTGDFQMLFGTDMEVNAKAYGFCEVLVLSWTAFVSALNATGMGVGIAEGMNWGHGVLPRRSICATLPSPPSSSSQLTGKGTWPSGSWRGSPNQSLKLDTRAFTLEKQNGNEKRTTRNLVGGAAAGRVSTTQERLYNVMFDEIKKRVAATGKPVTWVDYHRGALQSTIDGHKDFLVKLVKAQSSVDRLTSSTEKNNSKKNKRMEMMMMAEASATKVHPLVIPSSHPIRLVGDICVLCILLYYITVTPLVLMVNSNCGSGATGSEINCLYGWESSLIVDYVMDILMLIDLVMRSQYFAYRKYDEEREVEVMICDPSEIWQYRKSHPLFLLSVFMRVPWDLIALSTGYYKLWRLTKMLYVFLIPSVVVEIHTFLDKEWNCIISSESVTIFHLSIATLAMIVWIACAWSFVNSEDPGSGDIISSFYWCLTCMTTVGYGDIHPETLVQTLYFIASSMIAPSLSATIIATVASYVHNIEISTDSVDHRRLVVKHFLHYLNYSGLKDAVGNVNNTHGDAKSSTNNNNEAQVVPSENIIDVCDSHFDYIENSRGGIHDDKVLSTLMPPTLCKEVCLADLQPLVNGLPIFDRFNGVVLSELMQCMELQIYTKKSIIISSQPANGLYLVKSGIVNIIERKTRGIRQMHAGETFAEGSLLDEWTSNEFSAKCSVDCEIYFLSRILFFNTLSKYPSMSSQIPHMRASLSKNAHTGTSGKRQLNLQNKALTTHLHETRESGKFFLKPDGHLTIVWYTVIVLGALYNAIILPVRLAFLEGYGDSTVLTWLYVLDYTFDACFLVDILLKCFVIAFLDHNDTIMIRKRIADRYLHGGMLPYHVGAILPLDLIALAVPKGVLDFPQLLALFRLNRLLRLMDLSRHWNEVESTIVTFVSTLRHSDGTGNGNSSKSIKNWLRLSKLVLIVLYMAHCSGSIFFLIANSLHLEGDANNWADTAGILRECTLGALSSGGAASEGNTNGDAYDDYASGHGDGEYGDESSVGSCYGTPADSAIIYNQYMHSLYWATCVMYTVGYGDVTPVSSQEQIFNILLFVIGTCVFAMVIVYVNDIVCQLDVTSDIFKSRCDRAKNIMSRMSIDSTTKARVLSHLDISWHTLRGASGDECREFLPDRLYGTALLENSTLRGAIYSTFFIKNCTLPFLHSLSAHLTMTSYAKGDVLYRAGEAGNALYILYGGEVSLTSARVDGIRDGDGNNAGKKVTLDAQHQGFHDSHRVKGTRRSSVARRGSVTRRKGHKRADNKAKSGGSTDCNASTARSRHSGGLSVAADLPVLKTIREGTLGEGEFFLRDVYACNAVAASDLVVFSITFETFWSLVLEYRYDKLLQELLRNSHNTMMLRQASTSQVVDSIGSNLVSSKVGKLMKPNLSKDARPSLYSPASPVQLCWKVMMALVCVYISFSVPYCLAFQLDAQHQWQYEYTHDSGDAGDSEGTGAGTGAAGRGDMDLTTVYIDVLLLFITIAHVYLHCCLFAHQESSTVTLSTLQQVKAHYYHHECLWDLLTVFPLVIALLLFACIDETTAAAMYVYLRLSLMLILRHCRLYFNVLLTLYEKHILQSPVDATVLRVSTFVGNVWTFIHFTACLMCYVGRLELEGDVNDSWVHLNGFATMSSFDIYIRGFYWSAYTVITVGYGSITIASNAERIVAMLSMTTGAIICNAGIAAVFGSIISNIDELSGTVRREREACLKFSKASKLDPLCQLRLSNYYSYVSSHLKDSNEMADFLLLPETVRVDYLYSRLRPCLLDLLLLDPKLFPCKRNGHGGSGSNSHTSVISLANGTVVSQKEGSKSADKGPANKVTRGSGSGNVTSIQEEEEEERRDSVSSSLNNHLQMSLCSHDVRLQGFLYSLMKEVELTIVNPGQYVVPPTPMHAEGWEGDLFFLDSGECFAFLGGEEEIEEYKKRIDVDSKLTANAHTKTESGRTGRNRKKSVMSRFGKNSTVNLNTNGVDDSNSSADSSNSLPCIDNEVSHFLRDLTGGSRPGDSTPSTASYDAIVTAGFTRGPLNTARARRITDGEALLPEAPLGRNFTQHLSHPEDTSQKGVHSGQGATLMGSLCSMLGLRGSGTTKVHPECHGKVPRDNDGDDGDENNLHRGQSNCNGPKADSPRHANVDDGGDDDKASVTVVVKYVELTAAAASALPGSPPRLSVAAHCGHPEAVIVTSPQPLMVTGDDMEVIDGQHTLPTATSVEEQSCLSTSLEARARYNEMLVLAARGYGSSSSRPLILEVRSEVPELVSGTPTGKASDGNGGGGSNLCGDGVIACCSVNLDTLYSSLSADLGQHVLPGAPNLGEPLHRSSEGGSGHGGGTASADEDADQGGKAAIHVGENHLPTPTMLFNGACGTQADNMNAKDAKDGGGGGGGADGGVGDGLATTAAPATKTGIVSIVAMLANDSDEDDDNVSDEGHDSSTDDSGSTNRLNSTDYSCTDSDYSDYSATSDAEGVTELGGDGESMIQGGEGLWKLEEYTQRSDSSAASIPSPATGTSTLPVTACRGSAITGGEMHLRLTLDGPDGVSVGYIEVSVCVTDQAGESAVAPTRTLYGQKNTGTGDSDRKSYARQKSAQRGSLDGKRDSLFNNSSRDTSRRGERESLSRTSIRGPREGLGGRASARGSSILPELSADNTSGSASSGTGLRYGVIAKTFCHFFTIKAERLQRLVSFYNSSMKPYTDRYQGMNSSKEVRRVSIVRTDSTNTLCSSPSTNTLSMANSSSVASLNSMNRSPSGAMPPLATEAVEDVSSLTSAFGTSAAGIAAARAALRGLRVQQNGNETDAHVMTSNDDEKGATNEHKSHDEGSGNILMMARQTRLARSSVKGRMSVSTPSANKGGDSAGHRESTIPGSQPRHINGTSDESCRRNGDDHTTGHSGAYTDNNNSNNNNNNNNNNGDGDGVSLHRNRSSPTQLILENRLSSVSFHLEAVGGDVAGTDNGVDLQARRRSFLATSNYSKSGSGHDSDSTLMGIHTPHSLANDTSNGVGDHTDTINSQIEVTSLVNRLRRSSDAQWSACSDGSTGTDDMV